MKIAAQRSDFTFSQCMNFMGLWLAKTGRGLLVAAPIY